MTCRAAVAMRLRAWILFPIVVALFAMAPPAAAVQNAATQRGVVRLALQPLAQAPASLACSPSSSAPNITLPAVTIAPSQSNGLIGSPASVSVSFDCSVPFLNDTNYSDSFTLMTGTLATLDASTPPPSGSGIMFKTNLAGIDVQLTAVQNQASSGSAGPNGTPGWTMGTVTCSGTTANWSCTPANTISVTFTAQLVKTGAAAVGTVNKISNLLQFFDQDIYQASNASSPKTTDAPSAAFGTMSLSQVTVTASTCRVTANGGGTVTLPDVWRSALASSGKVAGATAFSIAVSGCGPALSTVQTYFSSNTVDSTTGNLVNTSGTGFAGNVEVRLLDGQNSSATINLNSTNVTTQTATTNLTSGGATLMYQAEYYATGAATAGSVKTTAQFTMVYQ
ncbi:fimbrial protein [Rhodanobacter sp. MP7CTX1]|uniref:fimbrial protein n=1 Tax=Rhodanobacter sp. MP7CTX1 TaxID=2723084 RepID=UPI001620BAF7|nr:fimbrial protein [Rhodanobacter sp. MP7CTX1]MBB6188278.1 type 1 fimbria pilin [Rhodanobacter sp. MP7CTX1]